MSATWITPMSEGRAGPRVAVKDLLDIAGVPTTAGCRAVADAAVAAATDAACLAGLRAAVDGGRARLAGKANLHELADGITGINPWFGTPRNPCHPALVPGGSSSGSAAAVGGGEADLAVGTDTAGSIRIPAACCGVAGLVTTAGRIPAGGVWPLAPSLDRVGPLARDVAGVVAAMDLLEPGFAATVPTWSPPTGRGTVARLRLPLPVDPAIDAAVDAALAAAEVEVVELDLPGWVEACRAGLDILGAEASAQHGSVIRAHPGDVGADVVAAFTHAARVGHQRLRDARSVRARWATAVTGALGRVAALALPTMGAAPPPVGAGAASAMTIRWTLPINLAGVPALALPVPTAPSHPRRAVPPSLQLVGPPGAEALLCALGAHVEASIS